MKRNKYIDPAILAKAQAAFRREFARVPLTPEQWQALHYKEKHAKWKLVEGRIVIL